MQRASAELRALGRLRGDLREAQLGLEAAEAEVGRLSGEAQEAQELRGYVVSLEEELQQEKVSLDSLSEAKERLTMQLEQAEDKKADLEAQLQEMGGSRTMRTGPKQGAEWRFHRFCDRIHGAGRGGGCRGCHRAVRAA